MKKKMATEMGIGVLDCLYVYIYIYVYTQCSDWRVGASSPDDLSMV